MARSVVCFIGTVSAVLGGAWQSSASDTAETAVPDRDAEASALVRQLGDEQFALRERAMTQLIEMGLTAHKALQEGRHHADREIRYRCERVLGIVEELDFQRRLAAFVTGHSDGHDLPGWRRYRERFGDDGDGRALFVEMQKAERELMEAIENGPHGVTRVAETRAALLQQSQQTAGQAVSLGSTTALLLAAGDESVRLGLTTCSHLYQFCCQPPLNDAMRERSKERILRRMLGDWVKNSDGMAAYQTLFLAMRYDLKEGLVPAVRMLKNPGEQPFARQNAILAITKLGDESQIELLESLLEDASRCSAQRIDNITYETQVRDVALASILILRKEDPKKFGFDRIQINDSTAFITSTVGFETDDKRKQVFAKYQELKFRDKGSS
jgi:HEAT repeat protein